MKKLLRKRIPTILGIALILLGIPLTTFVIKNQTALKSKASNSEEPKNIKIANISDQSFTITYQTDIPTTGSINYGHDKKLGESELEDIDKERESFSPKKIHSISIKKLLPSAKYFFTITSDSDTFLDNKAPFEVTTGPDVSSPSANQQIIKGKILLPNGSNPPEALVYLSAENSQLLSATVAMDGNFIFSLKELRTEDLTTYFNINKNTIFKIVATDGSLKSAASVSLNQSEFIPTITLSNDYDFAQENFPVASESAKSLGFPSIVPSLEKETPEIISPKENQSVSDSKPQFRGKSLPNETVEIIINSNEQIIDHVTADNNGNWTYRPSAELSPGVHTITIKARDSTGILTTVVQSFTVLAAEITPSPASPSVTPTQGIFPTLMPLPTETPILFFSPTPAIITPTPFPSPAVASIESKGGLPPAGNPPVLLTIGGIIAILSGLVLFFFTHKVSL